MLWYMYAMHACARIYIFIHTKYFSTFRHVKYMLEERVDGALRSLISCGNLVVYLFLLEPHHIYCCCIIFAHVWSAGCTNICDWRWATRWLKSVFLHVFPLRGEKNLNINVVLHLHLLLYFDMVSNHRHLFFSPVPPLWLQCLHCCMKNQHCSFILFHHGRRFSCCFFVQLCSSDACQVHNDTETPFS